MPFLLWYPHFGKFPPKIGLDPTGLLKGSEDVAMLLFLEVHYKVNSTECDIGMDDVL